MTRCRIGLLGAASIILVVVGTVSSQARAASIYVSPAGNDTGPGTIGSPVATPGRALTLAQNGDTIYLRAGRYTVSSVLVVQKDGLTISSYPGESAAVVGTTTDLTNLTSIFFITSNNVTLAGLEIQGASYYGVKLESNSGTVIRNCHIHDTGRDSVKMYLADNVTFDGCDMGPTGVRDPSDAQCINSVACLATIVRRCHLHDSANNGLFLKGGSANCVVEDNLIERTAYSGILLGQDTDLQYMRNGTPYEAINCIARNNVIMSTGGAGVGTYSGSNIRFENNTLYDVARTYNGGFYVTTNSRGVQSQQIVFKNNIVVVTSGRPLAFVINLSDSLASDSNIWFKPSGSYGFWRETPTSGDYWQSLSSWQAGTGADLHSMAGDPMVDTSNQCKLLTGSPAIDRGQTLSEVTADYIGTPRPQGSAYDIGAYEAVSAATPDQPPHVSISASVTSGLAPLTVNFVSTASDSDGQVVAYNWSFGDGQTSTQVSVSHIYTNPGSFTARLTVTDNAGLTASASVAVSVTGSPPDQPPQVTISASLTSGAAPLTVNFVATAFDPDGQVVAYRWDFGDGQTSSQISPSHIYAGAGSFTPRLTVTDNSGSTATASVVINVSNPADRPPQVTVSASPTSGVAPLAVRFVAAASDPDGQVTAYAWDFGDGQSSSQGSPSHTYSSPGAFTARVTVTDNSGSTATTAVLIVVAAQNSGSGSQNVTWTNLVGCSASGNNLTKTAESTWGNAGATSAQSIATGNTYVQFTAVETNKERMCGLSTRSENQGFDSVSFAVHLNTGGAFYVVESGASRGYFGDYKSGDVFRVAVDGGVVKYSRNGSVFYTSSVKPAYPLWVGAVLDAIGSTIQNAVISGAAGGNGPAVVQVLAPSNQTVVKAGSTYDVAWSVTTNQSADVITPAADQNATTDILLSVDGGETWDTVVSGLPAGTTDYTWSPPARKTRAALIRVILNDTNGAAGSGVSDTFAIKKPRAQG